MNGMLEYWNVGRLEEIRKGSQIIIPFVPMSHYSS
jgi:hypothetical protein